jgi:hypothetical protein
MSANGIRPFPPTTKGHLIRAICQQSIFLVIPGSPAMKPQAPRNDDNFLLTHDANLEDNSLLTHDANQERSWFC